jgi:hypothetical protein
MSDNINKKPILEILRSQVNVLLEGGPELDPISKALIEVKGDVEITVINDLYDIPSRLAQLVEIKPNNIIVETTNVHEQAVDQLIRYVLRLGVLPKRVIALRDYRAFIKPCEEAGIELYQYKDHGKLSKIV